RRTPASASTLRSGAFQTGASFRSAAPESRTTLGSAAPEDGPWPCSRSRLASERTEPSSVSSIICIRRRLYQGRMFEDQHFRFFWEAGERKVLFVRGQVSYVGLPLCPVVDTSKLFRPAWIRFEVILPVVHWNQDRWNKPAADDRDLVCLQNVRL